MRVGSLHASLPRKNTHVEWDTLLLLADQTDPSTVPPARMLEGSGALGWKAQFAPARQDSTLGPRGDRSR